MDQERDLMNEVKQDKLDEQTKQQNHDAAILAIAERVKDFHKIQQPFRIYHGSTNSTRTPQYERDKIIDTSKLVNVIAIDVQKKTVLVEPNVSMEALVAATRQYQLLPPVVMEFKGITVGGGFSGTSGESSSFKYGLFDGIVNWIELILADGTIVRASEKERVDLLRAAPGSFGTLGVVTLLELQLIDAQDHVELTYHAVGSFKEAKAVIERLMTATAGVDYIDGIMFTRDSGVIMSGALTNGPRDKKQKQQPKVQRFTRHQDPWCYVHARKVLRNINRHRGMQAVTELVPVEDYFFRYDRGGFWVAKYAFDYFFVPFNRVTRWLLEYFMHTSIMCHALHESGLAASNIVQDIGIPLSNSEYFFEFLDDSVDMYPLWLCPIKRHYRGTPPITFETLLNAPPQEKYFLNFGIWGHFSGSRKKFEEKNRVIEQKTKDLAGIKAMYARTYYTEDEFWQIYDKEKYFALREKYVATSLPTMYDKLKPHPPDKRDEKRRLRSIRPFGGLWGVFRAVTGSDYLIRK